MAEGEESGECNGWDAFTERGDAPQRPRDPEGWVARLFLYSGVEWRVKAGLYLLIILTFAGVLAGLVWSAWWLFVGEYQ